MFELSKANYAYNSMNKIKVVLFGDQGVGKTSIVSSLLGQTFNPAHILTVGVNFVRYQCENNIVLQIWDTAGSERFRAVTQVYYRGAMALLLVFDLSNQRSFQQGILLARSARQHSQNAKLIIIGNKADLPRNIEWGELEVEINRLNADYLEVSAKEGVPAGQIVSFITSGYAKVREISAKEGVPAGQIVSVITSGYVKVRPVQPLLVQTHSKSIKPALFLNNMVAVIKEYINQALNVDELQY